MMKYRNQQSGFSLVEAIVVAALSVMIFSALFASFQYTLQLINNSRAKLSAVSVANDRMEYFRSLPYADVGTISGIPSGSIPQNSTTSLNGIEFAERVLVEYMDDPADGQGVSDSNSIPADYKRVKVEYTWSIGNATSSLSLISNIVPRSVETNDGGGTIRINVIDADVMLLPGASVRLLNNSSSPTVDITKKTDVSGAALFSGAPAGSDYQVVVTANISGTQYSSTQTYQATTSNPNPIVAPFAVLEADVSTLTFQIGKLSDLKIEAYTSITEGAMIEPFYDLLSVATSTNVSISSGAAVLSKPLGVYANSGTVYAQLISPTTLESWGLVRLVAQAPYNTSYTVRFYTGSSTGPFTVIPDADLPGNGIGFTDSLIDISNLDATVYPAIAAGVTLQTSDTSVTPEIDELAVYYIESATPRSGGNFTIRGDKTIGTDADSAPIYKYSNSFTINSLGVSEIADLEFDFYTINNTDGYDLASACSGNPYIHKAGINGVVKQLLVANSTHSARVVVTDSLGRALPGALVNLYRVGYTSTIATNTCGQAFFSGGVSKASDYKIDVSLTGYSTQTITPVDIDGDVQVTVTLTN